MQGPGHGQILGQMLGPAPVQAPAQVPGRLPTQVQRQDLFLEPPVSSGGHGKLILSGLLLVGGLTLICVMLLRSGGTQANAETTAAAAQAPAENYFTQQQKMMREALDMAKEARAMQREQMQRIRDAMNESEGRPTDR